MTDEAPDEKKPTALDVMSGPIVEPPKRKLHPLTLYRPEMCEEVIRLGAEGASKAEIAFELDVAQSTFEKWQKDYPEFKAAIDEAAFLAQGWWEKQGRRGIWSGSQFNSNAYRLQVMNRFPGSWKEKRELEIPGGLNVTISNDDAKL